MIAELKKGVKAGSAVALLMGLLSLLVLSALFIMGLRLPSSYAYELLIFTVFGTSLVASAIIWVPLGILFALIYDKIPSKSRYKSVFFSLVPVSILFLFKSINIINIELIAIYLSAVLSEKLFMHRIPFSILYHINIIMYGVIGALLLGYFWDKLATQGKAKK